MRGPWRSLTTAAVALALVILTASRAPAEERLVAATTVEVAPVIDTVTVVGTVVAPRTASVSSEIASRVVDVEVSLGDRVDEGSALVRLDDVLATLDLERVRASARAEEARLANAQRRLEDARRLVERDNLPENEVEERRAAVRTAQAQLAVDEAEIGRREARIDRHIVRAPFTGTVVDRMVEAGEWVEPGTTIVALVATDRLVVDLAVPQRYFPRVGRETSVTLGFEAIPGESVEAAVIARVPRSDPTARTFRLRVAPAGEALEVAPGMSATGSLRLETGREAVVVPRDAVMRYPSGRVTVWVVADGPDGPDGREGAVAEERGVELGSGAGPGRVYVHGGLAEGARVITRGNEALRPGQPVTVEDAAPGGSGG